MSRILEAAKAQLASELEAKNAEEAARQAKYKADHKLRLSLREKCLELFNEINGIDLFKVRVLSDDTIKEVLILDYNGSTIFTLMIENRDDGAVCMWLSSSSSVIFQTRCIETKVSMQVLETFLTFKLKEYYKIK